MPQQTPKLTRREQEVLSALANGRTYKELAQDLAISMNTVRSHVRQIYSKLCVRSKTSAVVAWMMRDRRPAPKRK